MPLPAFASEKNAVATVLQALCQLVKECDEQRIGIANHLHKEVAGSLVACSSLSEMLRHELSHSVDTASLGKLIMSLDSTIRQAMQVVRDLTEDQFPPVLKVFGFNTALQQLVRSTAEGFAGSLMLHINGEEPALDLSVRLNLFRIMQALLELCVSEARASWVEVMCRTGNDVFEITIDHDAGESIWENTGDSAEIAVIKARCALLGARIDVMPAGPGGAARLSLMFFPPQIQARPGADCHVSTSL